MSFSAKKKLPNKNHWCKEKAGLAYIIKHLADQGNLLLINLNFHSAKSEGKYSTNFKKSCLYFE